MLSKHIGYRDLGEAYLDNRDRMPDRRRAEAPGVARCEACSGIFVVVPQRAGAHHGWVKMLARRAAGERQPVDWRICASSDENLGSDWDFRICAWPTAG
jgi:hypothetical protein